MVNNPVANPVVINARKFDGSIRRTWSAELKETREDLMIFLGIFEHEVKHEQLGIIRSGTLSYEYYWTDRWYNVFRFHEPDGGLRNYYCNVNMPPAFSDGVLDYVDLDIDVIVWPDGRHDVLDLDDFEANARLYAYPENVVQRAEAALAELLAMIGRGDFPFRTDEWA